MANENARDNFQKLSQTKSSMERFVTWYHTMNALFIISYIPIRRNLDHEGLLAKDSYFGIRKENEIVMLLVFYLISKYKKMSSNDEFVLSIIMYCKLASAALYYYIGMTYCLWYLLGCTVLYFTIPVPKYEGAEDVLYLNPDSLSRRVFAPSKDKYCIMFYADWCSKSLCQDPMFAKLSLDFSSPHLKFAKVDLGRYPELANEYNIDISYSTIQVPTFMLVENGKEKIRLPALDKDGKVMKMMIDRKGLEHVFRLGKK